jgi:hypothetical protein
MKLFEIPVNTLVELRFNYQGVNRKVRAALLYKNVKTVYVSAIKSAGKTIPAIKLKSVALIYKTDAGMYLFKELAIRSISYNSQNLYVLQTEQEGQRVTLKNASRIFLGAHVAARIIMDDGEANYLNCILKDIGMDGMSIMSSKKINNLAKIEISFRVNENSSEILVGKIIREYEFKNGNGFFYGCEFEVPNEIIGKYVARKQELSKNN